MSSSLVGCCQVIATLLIWEYLEIKLTKKINKTDSSVFIVKAKK